jgi:hypothetical protein
MDSRFTWIARGGLTEYLVIKAEATDDRAAYEVLIGHKISIFSV